MKRDTKTLILIAQFNARIAGMTAENQVSISKGQPPKYGEEAFEDQTCTFLDSVDQLYYPAGEEQAAEDTSHEAEREVRREEMFTVAMRNAKDDFFSYMNEKYKGGKPDELPMGDRLRLFSDLRSEALEFFRKHETAEEEKE